MAGHNQVQAAGKISRVGKLAYTPAGSAVLEFTLAVPQTFFDKRSFGNFEVRIIGDLAETAAGSGSLRIGRAVAVSGSLWTRTYTDRKGVRVTEVKIVASEIGDLKELTK